MKVPHRVRMALVAAGVVTIAAIPLSTAAATVGRSRSTVANVDLGAIACPSSTRCVAGGSNSSGDGVAAVVKPSSSTAKVGPNHLNNFDIEAVACPDKTTCLATATGTIARIEAATGKLVVAAKLSRPKSGIAAVDNLACASSKACYAVGFEGSEESSIGIIVHLSSTGAVLGTTKEKSATDIGTIACTSKSLCLVSVAHGAGGGAIELVKNGKPGKSHALPADRYVQALACYGARLCYVLAGKRATVDRSNLLVAINPKTGTLGKTVSLPAAFSGDGLACASATRCVTVGFKGQGASAVGGAFVITKGKAGRFEKLAGGPSGVACSSAFVCTAVGAERGRTFGGIVDRIAV